MSAYKYWYFLAATLFLASIVATASVSADECPAGTVTITAATRQAATSAGIPTSATCWNPSDTHAGEAAGEAKAYLMQHASKNANIACFNADYAEKLAKLLQAVPGGAPMITDGYRSPQAQANLPTGSTQVGACGSYHQYGMAADFNSASKTTLVWMRTHAREYGLTSIPSLSVVTGCSVLPGSTFCDPGHIQINAPLPARNQCGICSTTGSSGSGSLNGPATQSVPDDIQYYNQTRTAPTYSPSAFSGAPSPTFSAPSALTTIPSYTNPSTQTNPVTTNPATTPLGGICSPQFSCSNNVMYYQTTSCTTQVYQNCTNGCNGNSCALIATSTTPSTLVNQPITSTKPASTTEEILNAFANPVTFTASHSATSTPIALNGNISDVVQLASATSASPSINTITSIQPVGGQETFTSPDLSNSGVSAYNAQPTSAIMKVLDQLKSALLWALRILTGK